MAFKTPQYYPDPWAADQQLPDLAPGQMADGFLVYTVDPKPTRQTLNKALGFAVNGVLYFLVNGVPQYQDAAQYQPPALVMSGGLYYRALMASQGAAPATSPGQWEQLPWTVEELNKRYLSLAHGDANYLLLSDADARYYTQAAWDALFITQSAMASTYVTLAALQAGYLTKAEADALYLTLAGADARYAAKGSTATQADLTQGTSGLLTTAQANTAYISIPIGDARYLNTATANATYTTPSQMAGIYATPPESVFYAYNPTVTYPANVLAFDIGTLTAYRSVADNNLGHPLSDTAWWQYWMPPVA